MPGILGVIADIPNAMPEQHLRVMLEAMNRGQHYASGVELYPAAGTYLGWVAHPGSVAERESSTLRGGGGKVLLSGECDLPIDSLDSYDRDNIGFVRGLNGLYACVVVDPTRGSVAVFNDRYGSERIYVYERPGLVYFASEAKALLSVLPECRALDDLGVAEFLAYGSVRGPRTFFRGIQLLPGGTIWRFERGRATPQARYFVPSEWETQKTLDELEFSAAFERAFADALPRYFPATDGVGISITGGLDTRMIMACRPERSNAICYTYAGEAGDTLDVVLGRRVSRVCGLEHHVLRLGRDFLARFGQHLDDTVLVSDGCAGALGAHELAFSRLARDLAPVRLTGNFGSELLRAMSTYKRLDLSEDFVHVDFRGLIAQTSSRAWHPVTHAAFEEIPQHLFGTLAVARSVLTVRTPYLDNALVRLAYAAPERARRSAQWALGLVARSDPQLARIPTDRGLTPAFANGALNVRRAFETVAFKVDYLHKEGLPAWMCGIEPTFRRLESVGILGRHKFLAYRRWFQVELATYIRDVLTDSRTAHMQYLDGRSLPSLAEDHIAGRRNCVKEIHAVLTLEAVQRTLIEGFQKLPEPRVSKAMEAQPGRA